MSELNSYLLRSVLVKREEGEEKASDIITSGLQYMSDEIGKVVCRFNPADIPMLIFVLRVQIQSLERLGGESAVKLADDIQKFSTVCDGSRIKRTGGQQHE